MQQIRHPYPAQSTRVVFLKGTDREMGRQHGEQVGQVAREGMVKFYCDFWKRMQSVKAKGFVANNALRLGKLLLDSLLVERLVARIPDWTRERLRGCAEATGFSYEEMLTALVLPDVLPMLQAYLTRVRPRGFVEVNTPPSFGCTSFLSLGEQFLHGRNLDFPGVAYWDRYPIIQVMQRPGSLKVLSFTTAGVPIGGITAINEAQIGVSLHQHYCAETSVRGTLPFIIGEQILFQARSLSDALNILQKSRVASSWAFVVTDGKARRGFIYECHPRGAGVRFLTEERPVLAHSNYFQTPECRPAEYSTSCRMNWDNYWRKSRLQELVESRRGRMTMPEGAQFISDHYDPYWGEEKPFNRTVSQAYNIQSMVIDPENMVALLAEGDAPIHLRKFREYNLGDVFSGVNVVGEKTFSGYSFRHEGNRRAKEHYILSFIAAFQERYSEAMEQLDHSLAAEFTNEAALVAAILNLKAGEYIKAANLLRTAKSSMEAKMNELKRECPPPEYFEVELYLARAYDLLGKRRLAVQEYQAIASHPGLEDTNLRRIAAAEGPYTPAHLSRILMPYSSYIPFA